jgi:predicted dehydrogenase
MKIGIVGLGYWGKIILNNLRQLGYKDITICELQEINWEDIGCKYKTVSDYKKLNVDNVFVLTPATKHYEVCKYFLTKKINVFCEKPLDISTDKCQELFNIANKQKVHLFVDWLFLFNPAVHKLKEILNDLGKPRNIIANRMNFGPIRYDVNARWDLASHDVSIINHLLDSFPDKITWLDFNRSDDSSIDDSCVGILKYEDTTVQINTSWHHGVKDRLYTFDFDGIIVTWDDNTKEIRMNDKLVYYENSSPLHNSITSFFNNSEDMENCTLQITRILNNEDTF